MKFIGKLISVKDNKDQLSVVISGIGQKWEKIVLAVWSTIWLLVGVYFINEVVSATEREYKLFVVVFLCFWAFYFVKALQIFFWRLSGYQSIRIIDDKLILRSFSGVKPKDKTYFVHNIERMEVLALKDKSLNRAYYSGFWVKGLKMVSFYHKGKKIDFAPQISTNEARALSQLLSKRIVKARKAFA
jgi:hypothetical protein